MTTKKDKQTKKRRFKLIAHRVQGPHRSFRLTQRRDYVRTLSLPGYWGFTMEVLKHLLLHKKVFVVAAIVYSLMTLGMVGATSQELYMQSVDLLKQTSSDVLSGGWGEIGKGMLLLASIVTGNFDSVGGEAQQIYGLFIFLLLWMSTLWLLRSQMSGDDPKFREALYTSSAPLVPTLIIALLIIVQMLPAIIAVAVYQAASVSLSGGLAMLVFFVAFMLVIFSVYLVTSTFFALIIVTIPNMYPVRAIRIAGDLVIGRRIRIVLRIAWGLGFTFLSWAFIMIPVIIGSYWVQSISTELASVPIVPFALILVSSFATIFLTAYMYLFYRKVVDDGSDSS